MNLSSTSKLSTFALGMVLGVLTMFIFEHFDYMQFMHEYVETGHTAKIAAVRNVSKYKTNAAYYRPPEPKRYSIQREERGHLTPEVNGTRILCWIMTTPDNIPKRAKSVKDTWGKRCDILLFFSSKEDPNFPAIGLNVEEGPAKLFDKTRASLEYIYNHHLNDADWFFKADDDTYAIIENLRSYLSKLNTSEPHYLGRMLTHEGVYNSGAGYVFSRETLRRFKKALGEPSCPQHHQFEDVAVGQCLRAQGVVPVRTTDSSGNETFMAFPLEWHLIPITFPGWYPKFYKEGAENCSEYPYVFHAVKPEIMYQMEYLIYRVKVWPKRSK